MPNRSSYILEYKKSFKNANINLNHVMKSANQINRGFHDVLLMTQVN